MKIHKSSKSSFKRKLLFIVIIVVLSYFLITVWLRSDEVDSDVTITNETTEETQFSNVTNEDETDDVLVLIPNKDDDDTNLILSGCQDYLFLEKEQVTYNRQQIIVDGISASSIRIIVDGVRATIALGTTQRVNSAYIHLPSQGIFYEGVDSPNNKVKLLLGCRSGETKVDYDVRQSGLQFCKDAYADCMNQFIWDEPAKKTDAAYCKDYFFYLEDTQTIDEHLIEVQAIAKDAIIVSINGVSSLLGNGETAYLAESIEVQLSKGNIQYFGANDSSNSVTLKIGCDRGINPLLKLYASEGKLACKAMQKSCEQAFS